MVDSRAALVIYTLTITSFLPVTRSEAFPFPTNFSSFADPSENGKIQLVKYKNRNQSPPQGRTALNQSLYHQNAGVDPAGWLLGGQALDEAASALARPYYEQYGYHSVPRNYVYYDWGW